MGQVVAPVPGVEVVLAASDLRRGRVSSVQELLDDLVDVQDPPHQAVHLLVQALKPTPQGPVGDRLVSSSRVYKGSST